jgi:membrane fusion protein (multidrug efflux system)
MKIVRRVLYWIVAIGLVFAAFWFGFTRKSPQKQEQKRAVPVEVEMVSTGSIEKTLELTGWIKANQVVDIASKVAGRVESLRIASEQGDSIPVEEGVAVKKGQRLAVIDHDVYVAQVAAAQATVDARQVELADAEREKKRMVALYEGGSATEQNRDKTVTIAQLAATSLDMAKANLELAQINLRESTIISPIDGVVTTKHIDEGNLIRIGDRLVTVADMKTVKIIVTVAEKYGSEIAIGMPAKIKVDALAERVFDANVYSVYPVLDPQTHTTQIEIRLDNSEMLLKPGMFARVTLVTQAKKDVVIVSRDVVLGGKIDEPYVYVVEGSVAHKRIVKLGIVQSDRCEITDGLKASETLVVNGMHFLAEGSSVEIVRLEDIK